MITQPQKRAILIMFHDLDMSSYEIANDFWKQGIDILYKDVYRITKQETRLTGHTVGKREIFFNGETKTVDQWSRETGLTKNTIYSRLKHGWRLKDVLTTGVKKQINNVSRVV